MLKDKEVVSDPQRQYEIARTIHASQHGGINKTTATIAEKYHWVRIKETVSLVIKNCPDCKDSNSNSSNPSKTAGANQSGSARGGGYADTRKGVQGYGANDQSSMIERLVDFTDLEQPQVPRGMAPVATMHHPGGASGGGEGGYADGLPLDPQIMAHHHHHQVQHAGYGQPPPHHHSQVYPGAEEERDGEGFGLDLAGAGVPDTRMATERHVREHDEPMAFVHEGGYDEGNADTDADAVLVKENDEGDLVDFERNLLAYTNRKDTTGSG